MHHAENSEFGSGQGKAEVYQQLLSSAEALFKDERNWV
jgi:hypothetical protein